jgi:dipeptidyl aminopeptidase/acylaminoacyl peptidase
VATGDGQTFVVAATAPGSCSTTLYRFSLAANGTPGAMTAFTNVDGQISDPWAMAVSAGARFVAYQTLACGQQIDSVAEQNNAQGYLSVLDTVTGQTKRWTFRNEDAGNVSISADGSVVGFGNEVIDTSAAPGSLAARGRVVATDGEFGPSVKFNVRNSPHGQTISGPSVLVGGLNVSPDGKTVYFATFKEDKDDKPVWSSWQLQAFDLATGQTRLVRSFPGTEGSPAAVTFDPTGRYMIVEHVVRTGPTTELALIDIATGQLTQLNASWAVNPAIAW